MASPSPLGPRARRRRTDIARRVCAAARDHVAQGTPLSSVPLDQLLVEAEVPRSTFYVYFGDRAAVFRAVLDALNAFTLDAIQGALTLPPTASIDDFRQALAHGVAFYRTRESDYRLLVEVAAHEPTVADAYRDAMHEAAHALALAIAHRRGPGPPTPSDDTTATALIWMLERTLYQAEADDFLLVDAFARIFWGVAHPG